MMISGAVLCRGCFLHFYHMDPFYIGIVSGILTSAALVPQLVKLLREKKAENVSTGMFVVLLTGVSGWIWYGIEKKDVPVISTNIFSFIINICIIIFSSKYKKR
jgi:MtN3 and saliva related transmembrane protein